MSNVGKLIYNRSSGGLKRNPYPVRAAMFTMPGVTNFDIQHAKYPEIVAALANAGLLDEFGILSVNHERWSLTVTTTARVRLFLLSMDFPIGH